MLTLEINTEAPHEAILTLDGTGIAALAENLQWLREHPHDDLMITPASWGDWDGTLSERALLGTPYTLCSFWRIFHDTPERNLLLGKPVEYGVELRQHTDGSTYCELDFLATGETLLGWEAGLAPLQQAGDNLTWEFAVAYRHSGNGSWENALPLPPARMVLRRTTDDEAECSR